MQEERERSKEYLMGLRTGKSKACQVLSGKESTCQCRRRGFDPWVGKIPWRRKWQPIPVMGFSVQFSLVTQSCLTLCDPMNYSTPGFLSITNSQSLLKLKYIKLVIPSNHLIFCVPFSPHLQSFPASGSFQMSQFFASSG